MLGNVKKGMLLGAVVVLCSVGTMGCSTSTNVSDQGQSANAARPAKHVGNGQGAGRMERGGFGGGISYKDNADLLTLLKLDADKLDEQLKAGKPLAEVAKAQGVDEDSVIELLVKQQDEKWKDSVAAGKMTQEQVDKMKENASERIKEQIEKNIQERGNFAKGGNMEKQN